MAQTGSSVRLYGPDAQPLDVLNGVAVPAGTNALIPAVVDPTGSIARFIRGDALGRADVLLGSWLGSTAPTVGSKPTAASIPVTMATDQPPIQVTVSGIPGGAAGGIRFGTAQISNATPVAIRATTYLEQTVGAQRSLKSTSANDTLAGTGARKVKITYYKADLTGPFTETVNLNGLTAVTTVATDICFIEMMEATEVGSTMANVGVISLYVNTLGTGTVIGSIGVSSLAVGGDNQTQWAHHYVPVGKSMHLLLVSFGTTGNQIGTAILKQENPLVTTSVEKQILDYLDVGAANNGSTSVFRTPASAVDIVGPARIVLYGISQGTNTMFQGAFEFYEV